MWAGWLVQLRLAAANSLHCRRVHISKIQTALPEGQLFQKGSSLIKPQVLKTQSSKPALCSLVSFKMILFYCCCFHFYIVFPLMFVGNPTMMQDCSLMHGQASAAGVRCTWLWLPGCVGVWDFPPGLVMVQGSEFKA